MKIVFKNGQFSSFVFFFIVEFEIYELRDNAFAMIKIYAII